MANYRTINVTQDDIDGAIRNSSARCVVANAIHREIPKATRIKVEVHGIRFTLSNRRYTYLTPLPVEAYIVAFDAGDTIRPFRFRLRDDQRIVVKRQAKTPAGKKEDGARAGVRNATRRLQKAQSNPEATEAEVQVAAEKVETAEQQYREVKAEVADQPKSAREHHDDVPAHKQRAMPKGKANVFQGDRVYGGRVLRINNDPGPGEFHGPLDIEPNQ